MIDLWSEIKPWQILEHFRENKPAALEGQPISLERLEGSTLKKRIKQLVLVETSDEKSLTQIEFVDISGNKCARFFQPWNLT